MYSWVRYSVAVYLGLLMAGSIMASSSMTAQSESGQQGVEHRLPQGDQHGTLAFEAAEGTLGE